MRVDVSVFNYDADTTGSEKLTFNGRFSMGSDSSREPILREIATRFTDLDHVMILVEGGDVLSSFFYRFD